MLMMLPRFWGLGNRECSLCSRRWPIFGVWVTGNVADAHDAGPVLGVVKQGVRLMLMMLGRFWIWVTGSAADAHDDGLVLRFG